MIYFLIFRDFVLKKREDFAQGKNLNLVTFLLLKARALNIYKPIHKNLMGLICHEPLFSKFTGFNLFH